MRRASVLDSARVCAHVFAPMIAQGVVLRRPRLLGLAARRDSARRANALLADLRRTYGAGPLAVSVFGRLVVLPLCAADARAVLGRTPDPFTPANREKRAALDHFEPHALLVTPGPERPGRRRFNEAVLGTPHGAHHLAGTFLDVVREEIATMSSQLAADSVLEWPTFHAAFSRIVRRIVLGDGAAGDRALTKQLDALRADANWAFAHRRRTGIHDRFTARLRTHLDRAEPGCLAAVVAHTDHDDDTDPAGQVPHWLFAYDAAAIAAFNTLTLLAAHPEAAAQAREDLIHRDPADPHVLATAQHLRACVQESLRLWPTTLVILRDAERADQLAPDGAAVAVISSFFHRDRETLDFADRFAPAAWLDGRADPARGIVPFSAGPAACPGRNLVLFTVTAVVDAVLRETAALRPTGRTVLDRDRSLPHTLDHTATRLLAPPAG
ncbi:cytochrome P450 [Streptomyces sp. SID3343]|uniref:cytochrome P450 n=1 Tax=Streptomyces sp. SID3343 TaxID=2690260 RepID=UPI0031F96D89